MLAALTPTLFRAGSGTGDGAWFSIVFGRVQLMGNPGGNAGEGRGWLPLGQLGRGSRRSTVSEGDSNAVFAVGFSRFGSTEPGNSFASDRRQ